MHQILLNLCVNARDAMPDGGSLTIDVENRTLDEHYAAMEMARAKAGRYVFISVTDSGMGIPEKHIHQDFRAVFHDQRTEQRHGPRTIDRHGHREEPRGNHQRLQRARQGHDLQGLSAGDGRCLRCAAGTAQQAVMPRGNGETILVVDDETSILTITRRRWRPSDTTS